MSEPAGFFTTPPDKVNFPATNQAHYCWQKYNEYVLCVKHSGEDACQKPKMSAYSQCPKEWTTAWEEQREAGTFLGVQEKPEKKGKGHH